MFGYSNIVYVTILGWFFLSFHLRQTNRLLSAHCSRIFAEKFCYKKRGLEVVLWRPSYIATLGYSFLNFSIHGGDASQGRIWNTCDEIWGIWLTVEWRLLMSRCSSMKLWEGERWQVFWHVPRADTCMGITCTWLTKFQPQPRLWTSDREDFCLLSYWLITGISHTLSVFHRSLRAIALLYTENRNLFV